MEEIKKKIDEFVRFFKDHRHTGTDGQKINFRDLNWLPILTAEPTYTGNEGEMAISNVAGTYKLHIYINGGWRDATLT